MGNVELTKRSNCYLLRLGPSVNTLAAIRYFKELDWVDKATAHMLKAHPDHGVYVTLKAGTERRGIIARIEKAGRHIQEMVPVTNKTKSHSTSPTPPRRSALVQALLPGEPTLNVRDPVLVLEIVALGLKFARNVKITLPDGTQIMYYPREAVAE